MPNQKYRYLASLAFAGGYALGLAGYLLTSSEILAQPSGPFGLCNEQG